MKFSQNTVMAVSNDSQEPGQSGAHTERFRHPSTGIKFAVQKIFHISDSHNAKFWESI